MEEGGGEKSRFVKIFFLCSTATSPITCQKNSIYRQRKRKKNKINVFFSSYHYNFLPVVAFIKIFPPIEVTRQNADEPPSIDHLIIKIMKPERRLSKMAFLSLLSKVFGVNKEI